mmetsp:Transcript_7549/g.16171  ORF Transcript_7549/g.16171 Transcript_7549/m.16171 type:complete len:103 (+) Transcript_7549:1245-1553(+)
MDDGTYVVSVGEMKAFTSVWEDAAVRERTQRHMLRFGWKIMMNAIILSPVELCLLILMKGTKGLPGLLTMLSTYETAVRENSLRDDIIIERYYFLVLYRRKK